MERWRLGRGSVRTTAGGRIATFLVALLLGALVAGKAEALPRKVLILGLDGTRPDALRKASTPNLDRLVADGFVTWNARTCRHSSSGPGWSSILTGVWEDKHKVVDNSFAGKDLVRYPPLFKRLQERFPEARSAATVDWAPLKTHLSAGTAAFDLITTPDPRDFITQDSLSTLRIVKHLAEDSLDVFFAYLVNIDETGHASGFSPDNPRYIAAIESADAQVGRMLAALESRPTFKTEAWLILATTDHGGSARSHGQDIPEHTTTWLLASGAPARKGVTGDTAYAVDVAATALAYLMGGPQAIPAEWGLDGKAFGLLSSTGIYARESGTGGARASGSADPAEKETGDALGRILGTSSALKRKVARGIRWGHPAPP